MDSSKQTANRYTNVDEKKRFDKKRLLFICLLGYYRVNYDDENWKLLSNYLKTANRTRIHVLNRIQLMMDAVKLNQAGFLNPRVILDLIDGLRYETDFVVHHYGFIIITWFNDVLINTKYYAIFQVRPLYICILNCFLCLIFFLSGNCNSHSTEPHGSH